MIRSNFHTHSAWCDGKDSPAALARQALKLGFTRLGFSGHAAGGVEDYAMTAEGQRRYRAEVLALRERYAGRLELLCGLENDLFAPAGRGDFDYCIASVHYVQVGERCFPVDESAALERETVESGFGGSFEAYAAAYFAALRQAVHKHRPALIGHLDLLMKFADQTGRRESPAYLAQAEDCIRALAPLGIPFEINTGAMARGYRREPYPSAALLRLIRRYGGEIALSSDCHDLRQLSFGLEEAAALARECGFRRHALLRRDGVDWEAL